MKTKKINLENKISEQEKLLEVLNKNPEKNKNKIIQVQKTLNNLYTELSNIDNSKDSSHSETLDLNSGSNTSSQVPNFDSVESGFEKKKEVKTNPVQEEQIFDGTVNFGEQYDIRFSGAYSQPMAIGNNMPTDENVFVGLPSLMNPLALIRFDKIVGQEMNQNVLDQSGNYEVRGAIKPKNVKHISEYSTVNDDGTYSNSLQFLNTDNVLSTQKEIVGEDKQVQLSGKTAFVDGGGNMYNLVEDKTQIVLKSTNPSVLKPKPPAKMMTNPVPPEITIMASELENTSAGSVVPVTFWYSYYGLTKCENLPNGKSLSSDINILDGYIPAQICEELSKPNPDENIMNSAGIEIGKVAYDIGILKNANFVVQGSTFQKSYLPSENENKSSVEIIEPNFENLCNIDSWRGREQFAFSWSDFLYCGGYNKIPNNRLITLRRFAQPVFDSAAKPNSETTMETWQPIARAVTWMDIEDTNKLSEILNLQWGMKWKDLTAQVNTQRVQENDAPEMGKMTGMAKFLGITDSVMTGSEDVTLKASKSSEVVDPYENGPKSNDPYGPVNSINETKQRDVGLTFSQNIKLSFFYDLNSIGGINPKMAALDIIANILALTYSDAPFWGGANRFHKDLSKSVFPGDKKGLQSLHTQNVGGFIDAIGDQLSNALGNIASTIQQLFSNPRATLDKLLGNGTKTWMARKSATSRPAVISFKSLLTGEPVGEWHITIGNPFNPIAMMGNMILKDVTLSFPEQTLGIDDFPTKMQFDITLEHGRPRDKGDIESIFNNGKGKLHYAYKGQNKEHWNMSSATQTTKVSKSVGATNSITGSGNSVSKEINIAGGQSQTDNLKNSYNVTTNISPPEKIFQSNSSKLNSRVLTNNAYFEKTLRKNIAKLSGGLKDIKLSMDIGFKNKLEADKPSTHSNSWNE